MRKLLMTFCMMCAIFGAVAQINYLNEEERSVYLHHKKEFDARYEIAKNDEFYDLAAHYVIKKRACRQIENNCRKDGSKKTCLRFSIPRRS